jgi:hypothetical protein
MAVKVVPSVLVKNLPCLPEPGWTSMLARNQTVVPEKGALAVSVPTLVVFQLLLLSVAPVVRLSLLVSNERWRVKPRAASFVPR